ncbi:MAG: RNA 2',3'-cyclic phosphodiesterase [Chloroflexota bacterium]
METIRAFVAIELPEEVKNSLAKILRDISPGYERSVKWVNSNSVHLTLKFLGNISAESVENITRALTEAASETKSFTLQLGGLGAFPNLKSPRVVWVGVEGDVPTAVNLQEQVDQALAKLGFAAEKRKFSPHLTIGRIRDKASSRERSAVGSLVSDYEVKDKPAFTVEHLSLMKSTLSSSGAIYDRLASVSLDTE